MYTFGRLRSIESDELELMLLWRNSPVVRENMFTRHEILVAEHMAWWEKIKAREDQQYFMFELEGRPTGIVGFNNISTNNRNSSWGFYVSPEALRGSGTKLGFVALEYAFNNLGLLKLYGEVLAYNKPGFKMHRRVGFKVEGVFRDHHMIDNKLIDVYRMGILAHEWGYIRQSLRDKISAFTKG